LVRKVPSYDPRARAAAIDALERSKWAVSDNRTPRPRQSLGTSRFVETRNRRNAEPHGGESVRWLAGDENHEKAHSRNAANFCRDSLQPSSLSCKCRILRLEFNDFHNLRVGDQFNEYTLESVRVLRGFAGK